MLNEIQIRVGSNNNDMEEIMTAHTENKTVINMNEEIENMKKNENIIITDENVNEIVSDSSASAEILEMCAEFIISSDSYGYEDVAETIAKHPNVSMETFKKVVKLFFYDWDYISFKCDPSLSAEKLVVLVKWLLGDFSDNEVSYFFWNIIDNPNADEEVLDILAREGCGYYDEEIAKNYGTSAKTLAFLAESESSKIREKVEKHPNVTEEILRVLKAKKIEYEEQLRLAKDTNTSPEVLEKISKIADSTLRIAVAENTNASKQTLDILADDDDADVVEAVAGNASTSENTLNGILRKWGNERGGYYKDGELYEFDECDIERILIAVAKNTKTSSEDLNKLIKFKFARVAVAGNPNTYVEDLREFVRNNKEESILIAVAENASATSDIFEILAKSLIAEVRIAVAENPNTDKYILLLLANDPDEDVKEAVFGNRNTPIEVLAKSDDVYVRRKVAKNSNASEDVLSDLAKDEDIFVRLEVVKNPNVTGEILCELVMDDDAQIREIAAERLNNILNAFEESLS